MKVLLILVGIVAVFWGVTLWKAARHEARAQADYPPLGQFVTVGGARLHLLQVGQGPDIVLIHGASGNMRDFTMDLVGRLSDRYRVTVVDRPGLGHSDRLDRDGATIFEQADVLVAAVAQLGVERPLVLGHSYGGAVALAWATRHPEATAGLILLAAASNPWEGPLSTYYRVLSHPLGQALAVPILTAWVPDHVVTDTIASVFAPQPTPEGYDQYIGAGLTLQRRALRENALQRAGVLAEVRQMVPDYAALDLPVEILHGDADTTVWASIHSEPLARQIAAANLVVMAGVGHSPHFAEPETVVAAIDRAAARAGLN
ncbi:alpha/beta fold hydrolase [Roseicyclus mahoneyensis]|uniref:Pimeloyl-ACP methyl ester carboxylesterase n=1 Tax=Roseicyclus mahoneyensis TaxID=164332 RepID=A0A316GPG1_9RHOB|nr:alpha/beta hydrolase [Roseicyclus mahoneyensis]PWK62558.1 pimeloyl-ACP methyl ester carboxylesterase [Roseicyclus mahoneyensis]